MFKIQYNRNKVYLKLTASVLTLLFILTPFAPVFAITDDNSNPPALEIETTPTQADPVESTQEIASPDAPAIIPTDPLITDSPQKDLLGEKDTAPEKSAVDISSVIEPETPTSPNASAPQKTLQPKTDLNTGALTFEYSITVPPGRNGQTPDIKLQYNSKNNFNDSIFGYGWTSNIPYIERINKTGTDKLYTENYFYSSTDGELISQGNGVFTPKTESGNFSKYNFSNNQWLVTDKQGTTYKFGYNASTRQDDPSNSAHIFKWMLEEVKDTNGNYITYTYHKNAGQIYPSAINYSDIFEIEFLREARIDINKSYATAFLVTTNYRINEIQTKINSTWVKKYNLTYTTGDNGARSLLSSIAGLTQNESGIGSTAILPTTFEYQKSTDAWAESYTTYIPPHNTSTNYQQVIDINGDSYPDIIESYFHSNPYWSKATYLNTGKNTWSYNHDYRPPIFFYKYENRGGFNEIWDQGVRIVDVDGDQLPDIIESRANPNGAHSAYRNTGNGWSLETLWNPTIPFIETYPYSPLTYAVDLNADALTDIIKGVGNNQGEQINNGNGFNAPSTTLDTPVVDLTYPIVRIVDVNGDHLPDILEHYWGNVPDGRVLVKNAYINKGNGEWQQDNTWAPPVLLSSVHMDNFQGVNFVDINGDGLVDLIMKPYLGGSYLNTGSGWTPANFLHFPPLFSNVTVHITDINADGLVDVLKIYTNYTHSVVREGLIPDLLSSITLPTGGKVDVTYKSSAQYKDTSGNLLNPELPFIIQTVNTITTTDPVSNVSNITTYSYEGGSYFFKNALNRKFAGFNKVTETDSAGNITTTYYHQGNTSNSSNGEYNDDEWKIGKPYKMEIADSSGNLYSRTINKWDETDLGNGSKFVKLTQTVDSTFDGDATHKDKANAYTYDNTNGNVTQEKEYGEVTTATAGQVGNNDGSFVDNGNDDFTINYTYASNITAGILGLPNNITVTDRNGVKVEEVKYYYDDQSLGIVLKGNQTKNEIWKTGSTYINTQKVYNNLGLVTQNTDANGNTTNYVYDANNLYPISITNALNQTTNFTYDYASGQVTQKTDPNRRVLQYAYDGLGRLLSEKQSDIVTPSSLVTKTSYVYTDTPNNVAVQKTDYLDNTNTADSFVYFDALGRKIQERKEAENGYSVKDYLYNNRGLLEKESLPYFSSDAIKTSPTSVTSLYTNYVYDTMQRIITSTNAVGTTTNTYSDWKLTITDANNKTKDLYSDARGNLVQVDEHNLGSTYSTRYTWNLSGKLLNITDALGNVRNFTYDGVGNRLTAEDLHMSGDGTFGSWSYTYDNGGNMTQSVSPETKTVNYTYDALNRELTENYTGMEGTEITYGYDSCTNGITKLCSVTMTSGANTSYIYDINGNTASEAKIINGNIYITSYTYDRQGNQTLITNSDNSQIKYIYNSANLLEQVQRKEAGDANFTDVVVGFDYSPTKQIATIIYANGATTTNTYDALHLYRLSNKTTVNGAPTNLQNLSYTYDANGNITQIIDTSNTNTAKTVNYVYDDLNRMTSSTATGVASGQSIYTHTFTYNAIGNIETRAETIGAGPTVTYTYAYAGNVGTNYANPHAVTSINDGTNTTTFTYDKNGNIISDGTKTHTFDYNNRLIQSTVPASNSSGAVSAVSNIISLNTIAPLPTKSFSISPLFKNITLNIKSAFSTIASSVGDFFSIPVAYAAPLAAPTIYSFKANPATIKSGASTTLVWSLLGGRPTSTTLTVNKSVSSVGYNNFKVVSPTTTTTYTLTARNAGGIATKSVTVIVIPPAPTIYSFKANPATIKSGASTTLVWSLLGGRPTSTTLTVNKSVSSVGYHNFKVVSPTTTTTYTLTARNAGGTAIKSVTVTVNIPEPTTTKSPIVPPEPTVIKSITIPATVTPPAPTTITYSYDHTGQRVKLVVDNPSNPSESTTTYYPNKLYNDNGTKKTKQIYSGDNLIATVETVGAIVTPYYNHTDHLNSIAIVSDSLGAITETLDYYPYGAQRIASGSNFPQRQYIGEIYDNDTGLSYLNARYYDNSRGQFISQDPVFWELGQSDNGKKILVMPQLQNSYSYAGGNPVTLSDPSGLTPEEVIFGAGMGAGVSIGDILVGFGNLISHPIRTVQNIPSIPGQIFNSIRETGEMIANGSDTERGYAITYAATSLISVLYGGGKMADTQNVKVGRWMSEVEYQKIAKTGKLEESIGSGVKNVSIDGSSSYYKTATKGSVYAEFNVPKNSLVQGGQPGWRTLVGKSAENSQIQRVLGQGGKLLQNITVKNLSGVLRTK